MLEAIAIVRYFAYLYNVEILRQEDLPSAAKVGGFFTSENSRDGGARHPSRIGGH